MTGRTHMLAGACLALALHASAPQMVLVTVGSVLPDVDTNRSIFGKYAWIFSYLLPHRGPTHGLLMLALATFIHPWLGLGVLTHVLLDMTTSSGVKLLWPYEKNYRLPFARNNHNNSLFETLFQFALIFVIAYICLHSLGGFFSFNVESIQHWFRILLQFLQKSFT